MLGELLAVAAATELDASPTEARSGCLPGEREEESFLFLEGEALEEWSLTIRRRAGESLWLVASVVLLLLVLEEEDDATAETEASTRTFFGFSFSTSFVCSPGALSRFFLASSSPELSILLPFRGVLKSVQKKCEMAWYKGIQRFVVTFECVSWISSRFRNS